MLLQYKAIRETVTDKPPSLQYHIVWCTKYRHPILTGAVEVETKTILAQTCTEYGWTLKAIEVMPDHVHLFLEASPDDAPSSVTAPLGEPRGFHGVSMVHFLLHAPSSCILYNNCFLIESGLGNDAGNRAGGHQCTLLDLLEFYSDQSSTGCGRGIIFVPFWKLWRGRRPMGLCMCQCGYSTTRGGSRIPRCGLRPRPVHLRGRWRSARTSAGPAHGLLYARRSMLGRLHGTGRHRQGRRAPWQGHGSRGCCAGLPSSGSPHVPRPRLMTAPRKDASHQDASLPAVGQCQGRRRVPRGLSSYSPPLHPSIWDSLSRQGEVFEKRTWLPRSSLATTSSNRLSIRKRSRCARDPSSGPGGPHLASGHRC